MPEKLKACKFCEQGKIPEILDNNQVGHWFIDENERDGWYDCVMTLEDAIQAWNSRRGGLK